TRARCNGFEKKLSFCIRHRQNGGRVTRFSCGKNRSTRRKNSLLFGGLVTFISGAESRRRLGAAGECGVGARGLFSRKQKWVGRPARNERDTYLLHENTYL